jgi:fermentation-respiration switch protein FrsA (DUF1100 family)
MMPVLVAHGDADSLIPLAGGQRLFQAFGSADKQFVTVASGDHDNVLVTPMPALFDYVGLVSPQLET